MVNAGAGKLGRWAKAQTGGGQAAGRAGSARGRRRAFECLYVCSHVRACERAAGRPPQGSTLAARDQLLRSAAPSAPWPTSELSLVPSPSSPPACRSSRRRTRSIRRDGSSSRARGTACRGARAARRRAWGRQGRAGALLWPGRLGSSRTLGWRSRMGTCGCPPPPLG
jgi:hypothetical protein